MNEIDKQRLLTYIHFVEYWEIYDDIFVTKDKAWDNVFAIGLMVP